MTGPTGRVLSRALGRGFDESCDGAMCDLEHDAGPFWVLDTRAGCETRLKAKQLPACISASSYSKRMEGGRKRLSVKTNQRFLIEPTT